MFIIPPSSSMSQNRPLIFVIFMIIFHGVGFCYLKKINLTILVFSIDEKGSYLRGICVTGINIFPLMGNVSTRKSKQ